MRLIGLILIGVTLFISSTVFINFIYDVGNKTDRITLSNFSYPVNKYIKSSKISEKIFIDNNWSAAKTAGICMGNGTILEPYIVEDLVIDGEGSGVCISIENTKERFIILNCTVFNSGGPNVYNFAGILLSNVSNGQLINNSCFFNSYGIYLVESFTIIIKGNNLTHSDFGIFVQSSNLTIITKNYVSHNHFGIILSSGSKNNCSENVLSYNDNFGISLSLNSEKNNISKNIVSYSSVGIHLQYCFGNFISGNLVYNNSQGIKSIRSENNTISHNNVFNNGLLGISLSVSRNNTILGNIINNNGEFGILVAYNSSSNTISGNNVTNNDYGMHFYLGCDNNIVSGNVFSGNRICIYEEKCQGNEFYDNGDCIPFIYEDRVLLTYVYIILLLSGLLICIIVVIVEIRKIRKRK